MTARDLQDKQQPKVLFFGRGGCDATRRIHTQMCELGFEVTLVLSEGRGEALPTTARDWQGEYILCFRSLFILPLEMIEKATIAAINFHPAPPEYPGSGCTNFALYDQVDSYGVTAHLMNELVDNGPILEVRRFAVKDSDDLKVVLARSHEEMYQLCADFVSALARAGGAFVAEKAEANKGIAWQGAARRMKDLEALKSIDPDVSKAELDRIIRATYFEGYPPYIELHGHKFLLDPKK